MNQIKTIVDQQYAAVLNAIELADKTNAAIVSLFPSAPEYADTALKMIRIFSDTAQEAMTTWAKQLGGITKAY